MDADVHVNADGVLDAPVGLIEAGVRAALATTATAVAEISVTLMDDAAIRALNERYLGRDRPTDVIAFALGDETHRAGGLMGDIYLGVERAWAQAEEAAVSLEEELVRLAVHGTLHVLGHDHPEGPERTESPMFTLQERLVAEVLGRR